MVYAARLKSSRHLAVPKRKPCSLELGGKSQPRHSTFAQQTSSAHDKKDIICQICHRNSRVYENKLENLPKGYLLTYIFSSPGASTS